MSAINRTGLVITLLIVFLAISVRSHDKPAWAKKKVTDMSDADMERLLDQWNVSRY